MEISVKEFRNALEIVKPGLATKVTNIEQVTSFAFTGTSVITYNDEICLQHPIDANGLSGAIEAEKLYKFLTKIKTETIKVENTETEITLKSSRVKALFNLDSEIKLPIDDNNLNNDKKWKKVPSDFISALQMARGSASKDMSDPKLTCVHINKKGFIESSDSHRIFNYKFEDKLPCKTVLIPAETVLTIVRINPTKVASSDEWIHFKNEANTILSCRVLNEDFVETGEFLETEKKGINLKFPKELADALDTAEIFSDVTTNNIVTVSVKKKKITVIAESETAKYKEELDMESKSESFAFQITPYLLKDILKQTTTCTIYKDRLLFQGDNWKYVTELSHLTE
jgi:DNA polymerase III sliding clamp (beta) subunit (PCNA family)